MCHLALAFADNAPKDPYLSKATEAEANEVVNVGIDYIYGLKRRTLVLFVVIHQKEIRWVFFIVDSGAPLTYLSIQVSA